MAGPRTPPHLATLVLLTAATVLSLNMFLPSLASIATDLGTDYARVSLAVAGYLALTAVVQLVVGPLSDRIGRRPVLLGAVGGFALASLGCSLASSVEWFLIFRMLQGGMVAGGAMSMAIVRDTRNEREAASLIGYIGMAMAVAPMLGPMLGGFLDTAFGWRANFYLYTGMGVFLVALVWIDLGETRPEGAGDGRPKGRELLKERLFWAYAACTAFATASFYVFLTGAPLVAAATFGLSSAELGLYVGSITGGFMLGSFVAGKLAPKVEVTTLMLLGRLVGLSGLLAALAFLLAGQVGVLSFFGCTIFVGVGNGITMPGSNSGAMSVRPDLAGSAAGFSGALTVGVGAVLTWITGQVLPDTGAELVLLFLMLGAVLASLVALGLAAHWRGRLKKH